MKKEVIPPAQAFKEILEENKASIYRICSIYAVAPVEPQDLFQEVVYHLWKSLPSFQGKSKASTWAYRVALNVCYRAKLKFNRSNRQTIRLDAIHFVPSSSPPDHHQQEKHQALYECISSLKEADQSLIILYLEELSYREISQITGLTENHVAVKMKRIREKLFQCITRKLL